MKLLTLALLLFCASVEAKTQPRNSGQALINAKCKSIHISLPLHEKRLEYPAIFKDIAVVDFRRDTFRIGLTGPTSTTQDQLLFRTSTSEALSSYLNSNYANPAGERSLLVAIKDCWFSNAVDSPSEERHRPKGFFASTGHDFSFRYEAYLKTNDGYIPLTYLDTLAVSATPLSMVFVVNQQLPDLIFRFMEKVASVDLDQAIMNKRTVSYNQVDSFCRVRFDYPMDTATQLVKGVYADISEFRNNSPSIADYQISKDKNANLELHIRDENGQFYFTHKVWGLCDGNQIYVMMDGNLFPAFCVHHQFYVLGSKEYYTRKAPVPFLVVLPAVYAFGVAKIDLEVLRKLRLFRIDVESGAVIW